MARNEVWFVPPIVVPIPIAISLARYVFFALSEDSTMDDPGEELLARNMVDVHGAEAAIIARENARGAAVAGQAAQAKSWIRVLGIIQRSQALKSSARLRP